VFFYRNRNHHAVFDRAALMRNIPDILLLVLSMVTTLVGMAAASWVAQLFSRWFL